MPSSVYLHDGEKQITLRFPTEEDRERFKAHYRALNALAVQYREECDRLRGALVSYETLVTCRLLTLKEIGDFETNLATCRRQAEYRALFPNEAERFIAYGNEYIDAITTARVQLSEIESAISASKNATVVPADARGERDG